MPPCPPTVRGRVGALLVRAVRRTLFWYSAQIEAFQSLVGRAADEVSETLRGHLRAIDVLTARHTTQADEIAALGRRINQVTQLLDQALERVESDRREGEEALHREISDLKHRPAERQGSLGEREDSAAASEACLEQFRRSHAENFRGGFSEIKERLRIYLQTARIAFEATGGSVLDLGCGRGEWLRLMQEESIPARGVDSSADMVHASRDSGLEVDQADILVYLPSVPDQSVSVLTAFHVLEHLHWTDVVQVMDHTARILKPGGVAIFETPNPRNLQVATYGFYLDPTHVRPLPSDLLSFLAKAKGLSEIETIFLHPYPENVYLEAQSPEARLLNDVLFNARDYALVARKPKP